jgi:hypothetical protein
MKIYDILTDVVAGENKSPLFDETQYTPDVRKDRQKVLLKGFNPESSDYDYLNAEKAGILPEMTGRNKGHMGSVAPVTSEIYEQYKKHGLPSGEAYIVLKGANHPTHNYLVEGEAERGFEIKKYGDRFFSVPKQTKSIFGYPIVEPDEGLLKWFKENPQTTGMQWGAGKNDSSKDVPRSIVLNPFSKLSNEEQMAVAKNEAIRNFIDEKNIIPKFNLTPEQEKAFAGTQYGKIQDKTPLKQSVLARILTGDESAGTITPMQKRWADWLKTQLPKE